jgi:hypothetical protein
MEVVPLSRRPLLFFDDQRALAGQHEETLLDAFRVVERVRVTGPGDTDVDADVVERLLPRLERILRGAFRLVADGERVPEVEHEPAEPSEVMWRPYCVASELASFPGMRSPRVESSLRHRFA